MSWTARAVEIVGGLAVTSLLCVGIYAVIERPWRRDRVETLGVDHEDGRESKNVIPGPWGRRL